MEEKGIWRWEKSRSYKVNNKSYIMGGITGFPTWKCRRSREKERKKRGRERGNTKEKRKIDRDLSCLGHSWRNWRGEREKLKGITSFRVSAHLNFFPWRLKKIEVVRDLEIKLQFIAISLDLWSWIPWIASVCLVSVN